MFVHTCCRRHVGVERLRLERRRRGVGGGGGMHTQNHRHAYNVRVSVREIDERDAGCNAQVLRHQLRDCATADSHVQCIVVAALEVLACSKALFDADDPPPHTHRSRSMPWEGERVGRREGRGKGRREGRREGQREGRRKRTRKRK